MSYNYNPSSKKAEEFINHEEILETLSYAEKNKNNVELIDQILAKARLRKGLSHREAAPPAHRDHERDPGKGGGDL